MNNMESQWVYFRCFFWRFLILAIVYAVFAYNNLVNFKHNVSKAWANIDVLLKQRHDEIPKLVETCKQYMKFEQTTLEKVMQARAQVSSARESRDIGALGKAEGALRAGLGSLFAVAEAYPELKSNEQFLHLHARISNLENAIADRREFYNESVNINNVRVEQFPDNIVAGLFSFKTARLLEFASAEKSDVDVRALVYGLVRRRLVHVKRTRYRAMLACFSFGAWLILHRRFRLTADMPTSRIGSAVQGYVELKGAAAAHPSSPTFSPMRGLPCVWFDYSVQEKRGEKWETISRQTSDATFLLRDGSGECIVDPDHAEIMSAHMEVKIIGETRQTERLLLAGDRLYALGQFKTLNPVETHLDTRQDLGNMLAEWKRDKKKLMARFDLNQDGEIDEKEWQLARAQAKREVAKQHRELRAQPGFHLLHKPADGRHFLITNKDQEKIERSLRNWSHIFS